VSETKKEYSSELQASAMDLMKAIKSPDGYEPVPWTQIRYHTGPGHPLKVRLLAHILAHTVRKGHFSPFAILIGKDGERTEMRLENFEKLLGTDMANVRRAWRELVEDGCTRNGSKSEGAGRLYICGNVPKPKGEDQAKSQVSTNLLPEPILKQIKDWDQAMVGKILDWWQLRLERRATVLADLMGLGRDMCDEDDDSALQSEWQVKPSRNKPHVNGTPESVRAARAARIEPLRPVVERLVQTSLEFVQSQKAALYNEKTESVQPQNFGATLLPETTHRQDPDSQQAGSSKSGSQSRSERIPEDGKKSIKQLPVPPPPVSAPVKLTETEQAFFKELSRWKKDEKHFDFDEAISPQNKGQLATVRKILATVNQDEAFFRRPEPRIVSYVEKRAMKPALGKRANFAMIDLWAGDFMRSAPEREQARKAFERAEKNSAALNAELDARNAAEQAVAEKAAEIWDGLPDDERARRAAPHLQEAKRMNPRMSPDQHKMIAEQMARKDIREKEIDQHAIHGAIVILKKLGADSEARQRARETLERFGIFYGAEEKQEATHG
jgi:hypothetical protein